jgi:nitrite reductase/ring-hydroxylating ferredoxin subunit
VKTIAVASSGEVQEGQLCSVNVEGKPVLLSRVKGKLCAFSAKCPHIGFSLARGTVADGIIRCPWHGSRFDMLTGANVDWVNAFAGISMPQWSHGLLKMGKEPAPLAMLQATEKDGSVFVSTPES